VTLPPLYAVVDVDACARSGRAPLDVADAFLQAGVRLLQVRAKGVSGGELLDLTGAVLALASGSASVIVNDRADVARLSGASGVHVGQDDLPVPDVRRILGPAALVGLSTHTLEQAGRALEEAVSYIAIGPVFGTDTKDTGYGPVGLALVTDVVALAARRGVPVVAIGGITLERASAVLDAGATSVCVIGDLLRGDPGQRARRYLASFGGRTSSAER